MFHVNQIIQCVSFPDWLLFRDFRMLILDANTSLNSFIIRVSFIVLTHDFPGIVLFIRRDRCIFYPFSLPVIDLFCLIALANSSSTMSNHSGDSGHPSLVADLRGDASSVPH